MNREQMRFVVGSVITHPNIQSRVADALLDALDKEAQAKQRIARKPPSKEAASLRNLFERLVLRKADFSGTGSYDTDFSGTGSYDTDSREIVGTVEEANVATSEIKSTVLQGTRHQLVIDIDHPAWLVKSSTPGHFHLYVEVPGGIPTETYFALLDSLAFAGVVEEGYARASRRRGYSAVRLPWVKKETPTAPEAAKNDFVGGNDFLDAVKAWGTGRQAGKASALERLREEHARTWGTTP